MEGNKNLQVKQLLYDLSETKTMELISKIDDIEVLYTYMYNYNWDNGFQIPQLILDNNNCDLSTALLIFYSADGISYLQNKAENENLLNWTLFIKKLYNSILNRRYLIGKIAFEVPLSKVQIFKLKKILSEEENIFIENIQGKNLDIEL